MRTTLRLLGLRELGDDIVHYNCVAQKLSWCSVVQLLEMAIVRTKRRGFIVLVRLRVIFATLESAAASVSCACYRSSRYRVQRTIIIIRWRGVLCLHAHAAHAEKLKLTRAATSAPCTPREVNAHLGAACWEGKPCAVASRTRTRIATRRVIEFRVPVSQI